MSEEWEALPVPERPPIEDRAAESVVERSWLTVTDLKQLAYCPRIVYYNRCLPDLAPRSYKMDAGQEAHEEERARAERRSLVAYDLAAGAREFDVAIRSETLLLAGKMDEVIRTPDGLALPVDYKLARQASTPYRIQLAAYGLLLEEAYSVRSPRGFLVLLGTRKVSKVEFTSALRDTVRRELDEIRMIEQRESMPSPTRDRGKCPACEYRRFCNDV